MEHTTQSHFQVVIILAMEVHTTSPQKYFGMDLYYQYLHLEHGMRLLTNVSLINSEKASEFL